MNTDSTPMASKKSIAQSVVGNLSKRATRISSATKGEPRFKTRQEFREWIEHNRLADD